MESNIPETPDGTALTLLKEQLAKKSKLLATALKEEEWALQAYNRATAVRIDVEEDVCSFEQAIEVLEENL